MEIKRGTRVYFVESKLKVREAIVLKTNGEFYLLRFSNGGGLYTRACRFYLDKAEAEKSIRKDTYDYAYGR